jgi:hypothetical protein
MKVEQYFCDICGSEISVPLEGVPKLLNISTVNADEHGVTPLMPVVDHPCGKCRTMMVVSVSNFAEKKLTELKKSHQTG